MVSIVTRLRAGRSGVGIPVKEREFSPENLQVGSAAHPASYSVSSFWGGVIPLALEVDYSHPPSSVVRNNWSCAFTPLICFLSVDGDNFTLLYL